MTIHLPENLGDHPNKLGEKEVSESYSVSLAKDRVIPCTDVSAKVDENGNVNFLPVSSIAVDQFDLLRATESEAIFTDVSRYDLSSAWDFVASDTASGLQPGQEAIIWQDRVLFRALYPGAASQVKFLPESSAIVCQLSPFSGVDGLQQAMLYSRRNFAPTAASPMLITMGVKMTLTTSVFCIKEWGLFNSRSGWFFRVKGDGEGDKFSVVFRGESGEVEIPRSQFNGDKIDGSGASKHSQTFTNVGMFGIEVGAAGVGAKFWTYVTTDGLPRWVLLHHLSQDSDNSQNRTTNEVALPITFLIKNSQILGTTESLIKYGCSVISIGSPIANINLSSIEVSKTHYDTRKHTAILALRCRETINNIQNSTTIINSEIALYSERPAIISFFFQVRDPADRSVTWTSVPSSPAIEFNSTINNIGLTNPIATVAINKGGTRIKLKDIFALQRRFLSMAFSNDPSLPGDIAQFALDKSELWIGYRLAANNNLADLNSEQILWDPTETTLFNAVYENNQTPVSSNFNCNLIIGEI